MDVSLKELLEAGSHFGHQTVRWHPKMKPYIFSAREGVHIFDLAQSRENLIKAGEFLHEVAARGGKILFVGTKRQAKDIVKNAAIALGQPYATERWLGGTLTNWEQIKKRIDKMAEMKRAREAGEYKIFTKKERLLLDREIARLELLFGGISQMGKLPDAIFLVDPKKEKSAVREAVITKIPLVAICDTNCDPSPINWVIPANDDAQKSIELIVGKIQEAIQKKKAVAAKKPAEKKAKTKSAKRSSKKA